MKRRTFLSRSAAVSAGALMGLNNPAYSHFLSASKEGDAKSLFTLFKAPPSSARPFVRWWWNGDLIEKEEVIRQLEILKNAGIGGVEINPIKFPGKDDMGLKYLTWLSDEWVDMVLFAVGEARKRGIICDLIVGSGWPFGGEFLEEDEQGQVLSMNISTYRLAGPAKVRFTKQELINRIKGADKGAKELFSVRMMPSHMQQFEEGVELINEFDGDILNINVPDYGEQDLCVIVKITGQQTVTRGAPGASGPVLNHFNKQAVSKYLNRISDAFKRKSDGIGSVFRAMFCDSLELDGNTWCTDMFEEFQRRRGYSLEPYLPFVLSYTGKEPFVTSYIGNDGTTIGTKLGGPALEEIRRVRYDYTMTKQELFSERFFDTFLDWCKGNGIQSRVQAYGIGYHPLDASMKVDIPECETWLGDHIGLKDHPGYTSINKFVSSAAKLAGKKVVSCEEITNISLVFYSTLESIKITGDQSNVSGVNHSVLHGYNYSPLNAEFPGWIQFGTFFSERNTWWPFFNRWTTYKARISSLFQLADPVAGIAVLHPLADKWSKYGQQFQPAFGWGERYPWYEYNLWEAIHQNGNSCDYLSEKIIAQSQVADGLLKFNSGSYHTLILMEVDSLNPEAAKVIEKFAENGGRIIFVDRTPSKSTGLDNFENNTTIVKETFDKILVLYSGKCKVVPAPGRDLLNWFQKVQADALIAPPVLIDNPSRDVNQIHYIYGDQEIFFFINSNRMRSHSFNAIFDVGDRTPWIWDPETGERYLFPYEKSKNELRIDLSAAESKLIVFDKERKGKPMASLIPDETAGYTLEGNWDITLEHIDGTKKTIVQSDLHHLNDNDEFRGFSGVITYSKKFHPESAHSYRFLDLGLVNDGISEVAVNGKEMGCKWYGRHIFNLQKALKTGENQITIKITTIIGNYCKSLADNPTCQEWTKNLSYAAIGMAGPVKLYKGRNQFSKG